MSQLVLHSYRRCPFAIRVRMTLEEKKIPCRIVEENLAELSPELLALHPEGRVPLLLHEVQGQRRVIFQSSVITEYLDEIFPEPRLVPVEPWARAQIRLWTYWCDQIFKPDLDAFKYDRPRKEPRMSDENLRDLEKRLHQHLVHWDLGLESGPYLLGREMTLADIHLFPFLRQFLAIPQPLVGLDSYSKLKPWLSRMMGRPSFERIMQKKTQDLTELSSKP